MDHYIGIDVSKATLDIASLPDGESWTVTTDDPGLAELTPRLVALAPALVVLEATGGFQLLTAITLAKAGLPLAVVNPRQVRDFAKAMGRLAQTDALDAAILADFAQRVRPEPRPLPDEAAQLLESLLTRRQAVQGGRHGVHAEVAHHPECHAPSEPSRGPTTRLTFKTVANAQAQPRRFAASAAAHC